MIGYQSPSRFPGKLQNYIDLWLAFLRVPSPFWLFLNLKGNQSDTVAKFGGPNPYETNPSGPFRTYSPSSSETADGLRDALP